MSISPGCPFGEPFGALSLVIAAFKLNNPAGFNGVGTSAVLWHGTISLQAI